MTLTEIALLATGAAGMIGFLLAYLARGQTIDRDAQLALAASDLETAKATAFDAGARAVIAETKLADANRTIAALELEVDSERKTKQSLVDALAKAGVPVGDLLVGSAIDRLYQDGRGQDPDSGPGGGEKPVPDPTSAAAAGAASGR